MLSDAVNFSALQYILIFQFVWYLVFLTTKRRKCQPFNGQESSINKQFHNMMTFVISGGFEDILHELQNIVLNKKWVISNHKKTSLQIWKNLRINKNNPIEWIFSRLSKSVFNFWITSQQLNCCCFKKLLLQPMLKLLFFLPTSSFMMLAKALEGRKI